MQRLVYVWFCGIFVFSNAGLAISTPRTCAEYPQFSASLDGRVKGFCNEAEMACERMKHLDAAKKRASQDPELAAIIQAIEKRMAGDVTYRLGQCALAAEMYRDPNAGQ